MLLTLASAGARLIPHPPNVAPIAALGLFAGSRMPLRFAWLPPLLAMLASDLFIGFYDVRIMATVYASFLAPVIIGRLMRGARAAFFFAGSIASSSLFFLATNGAVWLFSDWYPPTLAGLLAAYLAGLPFFRNTLAGDLLYTGFFFGAYAYARKLRTRRKQAARLHAAAFL